MMRRVEFRFQWRQINLWPTEKKANAPENYNGQNDVYENVYAMRNLPIRKFLADGIICRDECDRGVRAKP